MATYNDGKALLCCVAKSDPNTNLNQSSIKDVWNGELFRSARLKMLNGEQVESCKTCYTEESVGIRSHRQIENIVWIKKLGFNRIQDLISNTNDDGSVNHDLITVDLRLGNTCNLQCVMCRPVDSSKWFKHATILAKELKSDAKWDWQHKVKNYDVKNFEWYKDADFLESFYQSASNIKHIIFGGGEPLYIKEHKEIIKALVDKGYSRNIELRYHTNGTIWDPEVVELWNNFKFVDIMVSLDGCQSVNDYIRYPAKWSVIEENLKLYDDTADHIDVKILCTVQALNIEHLPDFAEWLLNQNYKKISKRTGGIFHPGILHYPAYLSTKVLPQVVKDSVSKKILNFVSKNENNKQIQKFKQLVEFMNSEDHSFMFDRTTEYLDKIDSLRDTNADAIFDFLKLLK
jgi:MoaA/NifB/PqqE/SkfB family radical SAM enzyme